MRNDGTRAVMDGEQLEGRRWQAVRDRDRASDGSFVYAVLTTGVYCRPSCPSRTALRENVSFHESPEQARRAGYRPCKRCRPDEAGRPAHREAVVDACEAIQSAEEEPDLATLASAAGLSPQYFQRVFKAQVGLSPKKYAMAVRKKRMRDGLKASGSVTSAIHGAGYANASRAYADNPVPGLTPRQYADGAEGETIRYASTETSLGGILVAATSRGICLVEFAEGRDPRRVLEDHFPSCRLRKGGGELAGWVSEVVALIDGPRQSQQGNAPLPLDIRGTAFQEKVWRALAEIPPGETASYSRLARAIGQPGAARAVAGACASNRLAVVVPCHRAVRESGALAGYKWGVERKKALLKREGGDA